LSSTEKAKKNTKYNLKSTKTDSYINDENVAYLIDYQVKSIEVGGENNIGTVYIRGVKGDDVDSFKFILEKANGFSDIDAEMIVNAYEVAFKSCDDGKLMSTCGHSVLIRTQAPQPEWPKKI
jgi:hypothetical protein